jgi:hypothetical protein
MTFMAPAVLDETGFDRFVTDNDTAVIGFFGEDGDAATFAALANNVLMERVRAEIEQETSARESLAVHRVCPATRRGKLE